MIKITIPGRPVPAVRMTQGEVKLMRYGEPKNPKYKAKYTRIKRYLDYKDLVGYFGRMAFKQPLEGEVKININIYISGGRIGDWDNYGKSICDSLNKIAFLDDRQVKVAKVEIIKDTNERAEVEISEVA